MKPDPDPGAQGGVAGVCSPVDRSNEFTQIVNCSGELGPPSTTLVTITFAVVVDLSSLLTVQVIVSPCFIIP